MRAVEASRETTLSRVLYAVGIPGIGEAVARAVCGYFDDDPDALKSADAETLAQIEGVGDVLAGNLRAYWDDALKMQQWEELLSLLHLHRETTADVPQVLAGKTVVITGKLTHFENRAALQAQIRQMGGKAAGSVSAKTDYLINNDAASGSAKNKKARELGVAILTEEEFMNMFSILP